MASERLQVILELITGNYKREAREAATATGQIGKAAQTTSTGLTNMGKGLSNFGTGLTRNVTLPLAAMAGGAIKAASDLGESVNAIGKVFGDAVGPISEFGETSAVAVGLSERAFNNLATVTGSLLKNLGYDLDTAADSTIILAERAADMASVFNTDVPTAMEAINSALKGEGNPIEQFGVRVSAAAVAAKAVALGLAESTTSVSDYAKAQATLALIMEQTTDLQGDFADTSDGAANSTRILKAKVEDAAAALGESLLPIVEKLLDKALDLVDAFNGLSDEQKELVLQTAGLVAIGGPALILIGKLVTAYAALKTALLGAAGAGGVAAGAGWWKVLGLGAAAGLVHREIIEIPLSMELDEEGLAELDAILGNLEVHDSWQNLSALGREVHDSWQTVPTAFDKTTVSMEFLARAAKDDAAPALWTFRDAQRTAADAAIAHRDALIQLTSRLLAQLSPAATAYQALKDLKEAQIAAADAAAIHGEDSREAAEAQLELAVATAAAQAALNAFGDTEGAVRALATALGIVEEEAAQILINLGLISATDWETTVVLKYRTDGKIPGEELGPDVPWAPSKIITPGGGPRAFGGPVSAYKSYLVGERGPEMFVSGTSGNIIPNDVLKSMSRPNTTIVVQSPMDNFRQDLQYATVVASLQNLVEAF